MGRKKQNQKIIKPPELPPEIPDDEIEVSDEDADFVRENPEYAGFVSRIDTNSINKHVSRVADVEELYEQKRKSRKQENEESELQVDPVEALPIKIGGEVVYRKLLDASKKKPEGEEEDGGEDGGADGGGSVVRLTKAEKRAKLKKIRKEAKKQAKESGSEVGEVQQAPQAAVLAEVKEDLTAEELSKSKTDKLAELGTALLADPESNIKSLREMLQICKDADESVATLGLYSLLAVFKDIIPGYRIRLPTEKELEMKVSKDVKKMRYYESTLLSSYKAYLQMLIKLENQSKFQRAAVRCICTLLDAAPHFNFRESLVEATVRNIGSGDDVIRKLCCDAMKSIFTNEGKHGGEATVEAVRLIANQVKAQNCQLHPQSIEVFLSLYFDEDLGKREQSEKETKFKGKKNKKRKNASEPNELQENDRKKSKRELMKKLRDEVVEDYKSVSFTPDAKEQRRMQSETLAAVFETYFRILKHTMSSLGSSSEADGNLVAASGGHPLLGPCLKGLAKFSHLIDLDYIGDLMSYLKRLAGAGSGSSSSAEKHLKCLTVTERLHCCIVAFKVMRSNLDALNVDLQGFFVQLYNLILEYRPGRDQGEVLAEALKIMLCEDRQHDMQKAAAFVKRLATFSLHYGSAESMAALVTLKHLLQKNVKCRNLLENDAGGGSVSGSIAKYQPYGSDPNLSGALASVLWELNLLSKHYHPAISTISSNISSMSTAAQNQVYLPTTSPQQAFADLSLERESFNLKYDTKKSNGKRKRGSGSLKLVDTKALDADSVDEDELRKKFSSHFIVLRDFKENESLRAELDRTTLALQLYEEYKEQKKTRKQSGKNGRKLSGVPK